MCKPIRHRKKWRIRWIDEAGRRVSEVYRTFKDAEHAACIHKREVEEIKLGIRLSIPPDKTFAQLCDYWIAMRVPQKRSGDTDESIIRRHLRPSFGSLLLREVGVAHADRFVVEKAHLEDKTIKNILTVPPWEG